MNTVTIKGVGVVHIPERNTKEEIITIVNQLKDDVETLNEMLIIEPTNNQENNLENNLENKKENIWCLHEECIEVTEPFNSEEELFNHTCECHLSEDKCSYEPSPQTLASARGQAFRVWLADNARVRLLRRAGCTLLSVTAAALLLWPRQPWVVFLEESVLVDCEARETDTLDL